MKNNYVYATLYGGLDWHDAYLTTEFLRQDGKYEVKNIPAAIAAHIYHELETMSADQNNGVADYGPIPSVTEIEKNVRERKPFTVAITDNEEVYASWNPDGRLIQDWAYGQVEYTTSYGVYEIEEKDVIYIASENYLAYSKGVPSVSRFVAKPTASLSEAEAILETHELHEYKGTNVKELLIFDRNTIASDQWYQHNMAILDILEAHPELNGPEHFVIPVQYQLEMLQKALA